MGEDDIQALPYHYREPLIRKLRNLIRDRGHKYITLDLESGGYATIRREKIDQLIFSKALTEAQARALPTNPYPQQAHPNRYSVSFKNKNGNKFYITKSCFEKIRKNIKVVE